MYRTLFRALITSAVSRPVFCLPAAIATRSRSPPTPRQISRFRPSSSETMAEKDMDLQSPILVRLFKQEAELEVWKRIGPEASRC